MSSTPPTLQSYEDILGVLNREVARSRPDDVLQFCANWFNARLAEQRTAAKRSREPSPAMMDVTPTATSVPQLAAPQAIAPSSSPSRSAFAPSRSTYSPPPTLKSALKKPSIPSLVGNGYTFGGLSSNSLDDAAMPSPFSETVPAGGPFGPAAAPTQHGAVRASVAAQASAANQPWQKSFAAPPPSNLRGSASNISDDDDDMMSGPTTPASSQRPSDASGPVSPVGIPLSYNLGRRTSVSAESLDPDAMAGPKRVIPKSSSQRKRIEAVMGQNLLFRSLHEAQHNDIVNAMEETTVGQGTVVINQGDVGEIFYIVEHGTFDVYKRADSSNGSQETPLSPSAAGKGSYARYGKLVAQIGAGGHFGELALMYNAPRAASVICTSPISVLWSVDRVTFRTILMEHTSRKRRMYERFLGEVPILATLEPHERAKIADSLEERVYDEGEAVVIEGEVGKNFYLIESGVAEVTKRRGGHGEEERVSTLMKGDYFGELALINSAPRAATVRALNGSGRLRVATLGEKAFTRLLGPVVEILQRRAATNYGPSAYSGASTSSRFSSSGYSSQSRSVAVGE